MTSPKTAFAQVGLGVAALVWAAFLVSGTGLLWWLAGNIVYGVLGLTAGGLHAFGRRVSGRTLAGIGIWIFITSNGAAAVLACAGGGACALTVGIAGVIVALQIAIFRTRPGL
jgi:hypothetical protein